MEPLPLVQQRLLPITYGPAANVHASAVRVHEIALQRFLNRTFMVAEGYPVPVVFATPTDAFSKFKNLFGIANGPFSYLTDLTDPKDGSEYLPVIGGVVYPLISVERKSWTPRINQSYGIRRLRGAYYVSSSGSVAQRDLAQAVGLAMPTAWDFTFNIEHYARSPETHALFIEKLMRAFMWAGGSAQTWIPVAFPGFYGNRPHLVRIYLADGIQDLSEHEPEQITEYRCGFTVVIEGYSVDQSYDVTPVLWTNVLRFPGSSCPQAIEDVFSVSEDIRDTGTNVVFNERTNLPKA